MGKITGYAGTIARVDLTSGQVSNEEVDSVTLRKYVGGSGLGTKYLYEEVPPGIEWSDPENRLMFFAGPVSGTKIPGSGGISISTQGAMTGGATSSQLQGVFGAYLRFCGLLGVIFYGESDKWTYLLINENGKAQLRDAEYLVGKDTWETVDALRKELGRREQEISILSIGMAGENLVRWAMVLGDKGHTAAHNGIGAVMGSKRLKAVAIIRGKEHPLVKDSAKLSYIRRVFLERVTAQKGGVHYYGTLRGVHWNYQIGSLPIKNYTTSRWSISEEQFAKFTGPYMHEHFQPRRIRPCWACPNSHCQVMTITEGPYTGMDLEEPDYEQIAALGPNLGINEITSVMMLANVVDRLGLDVNEAGWVLSCVMECFEREILTLQDTDGLAMNWGNAEAARDLLCKIARREHIGDTLAEGVMRAAQKIGRGATDLAIYAMKATPRSHDHRARWTEMFDHCVSDSGALDNTLQAADLTQFGLPVKVDPFDPDMLARAEGKMKGAMQFEDSLVTCRLNTVMDVNLLAQALSAVTGWDVGFEEGMKVGRRVVNTMRAFNIRNGITGNLDWPSHRYGSTPVDGLAQGRSIAPHFAKMLQDYYRLMGWDQNGKPLPTTLRELGLEKIAADIWV